MSQGTGIQAHCHALHACAVPHFRCAGLLHLYAGVVIVAVLEVVSRVGLHGAALAAAAAAHAATCQEQYERKDRECSSQCEGKLLSRGPAAPAQEA